MHRCLPALALVTACAAPTRAPAPAPANHGGDPPSPIVADASLTGPVARLAQLPGFSPDDDEPPQVTVLAAASGPVTIALREVRSTLSSAACLVTLETPAGFFAGDDFLCAADRSDEVVTTDAATATIDDQTASITFRTSYQLNGTAPYVQTYAITCTLSPVLSCTPPPAIGGYD